MTPLFVVSASNIAVLLPQVLGFVFLTLLNSFALNLLDSSYFHAQDSLEAFSCPPLRPFAPPVYVNPVCLLNPSCQNIISFMPKHISGLQRATVEAAVCLEFSLHSLAAGELLRRKLCARRIKMKRLSQWSQISAPMFGAIETDMFQHVGILSCEECVWEHVCGWVKKLHFSEASTRLYCST